MTRRRRTDNSNSDSGSGNWLTTYSDLVTLLLAFFVLLFSISEIDAGKFRNIMSSFQGGSGVFEGESKLEPLPNPTEEILGIDLDDDLETLKEYLEEYSEKIGLGNLISVKMEERGIIVRFMDNVFFDPGSATIKEESFKVLELVSEILNREEFIKRQIKVEGHTDTVPVSRTSIYETNWELSSARATNVLRYLVENTYIDGGRISSSGYSYYRNISPNDTKENKAKNRRVDIVILRDVYEEQEP